MPIYENLVIGNFLFALGLKIGTQRDDGLRLVPDLGVHLIQQTPLDVVLGDVLLAGPRAVALLEFKRSADRRSKERGKLIAIEALLQRPDFEALRATSRSIHFYVETSDNVAEGFSRVLPYLDLLTDDQGSRLERLIDDLALRARSGSALPEVQITACQRYLELLCVCQGRDYHASSPGLLVGVGGDGRIAFAPVDDIRDLRATFGAIKGREIALTHERTRRIERRRQLRHERVPSISRTRRGPEIGL